MSSEQLEQIVTDDDVERDVVNFLKEYTANGGWFDATRIGLEAGFDRRHAAAKVRGILNRLVERGVLERETTQRPAIYRFNTVQAEQSAGKGSLASGVDSLPSTDD